MPYNLLLPPSAVVVLDHIAINGPITPKDLSQKCKVPLRTISFAIKRLSQHKLIRRTPNLFDMRRPLYNIDRDRVREMRGVIDEVRIKQNLRLKAI